MCRVAGVAEGHSKAKQSKANHRESHVQTCRSSVFIKLCTAKRRKQMRVACARSLVWRKGAAKQSKAKQSNAKQSKPQRVTSAGLPFFRLYKAKRGQARETDEGHMCRVAGVAEGQSKAKETTESQVCRIAVFCVYKAKHG